MLSEELKKKIELYEQIFFGLDKPVPFLNNILIYPVKVKDYYTFYSNLSCLTMDKTTMKVKEIDEKTGQEILVTKPNPKGISQSYMAYLINQMENEDYGKLLTNQVITMLELVLHIENGFYCPHCHQDELTYKQMLEDVLMIEKQSLTDEEKNKAKRAYFLEKSVCPHCQTQRKDIISIADDGKGKINSKKISIYDTILKPKEFDEMIAIILHQNILNYDGDSYVDPDLKEAMEQKALMENKNYNAPSLEKQLICISISSPYTLDMLQEITLRKLNLMLKTVDAKVTYQAQLQGMFSGMVTFKEEPKHWIFSSDKKDMSKELTSMGDVREKFKYVT